MLYKLGRFCQIVGMILLPIAIAGNIAPSDSGTPPLNLRQSMLLSGAGVLVFWVGHMLQERGKPQ